MTILRTIALGLVLAALLMRSETLADWALSGSVLGSLGPVVIMLALGAGLFVAAIIWPAAENAWRRAVSRPEAR